MEIVFDFQSLQTRCCEKNLMVQLEIKQEILV